MDSEVLALLFRAKHRCAINSFRHFDRHIDPARLAMIGDDHLFDGDERSELVNKRNSSPSCVMVSFNSGFICRAERR